MLPYKRNYQFQAEQKLIITEEETSLQYLLYWE